MNMLIEELEFHLNENLEMKSLHDDIRLLEPTIRTNTYPNGFTTKKYYSLLTFDFAGIDYDLNNPDNILIKTTEGEPSSISKHDFLTMLRDRSKVGSIIEELIHVESIQYTDKLEFIEDEILTLSNKIKAGKSELEKLINKKHSLLNEQSN